MMARRTTAILLTLFTTLLFSRVAIAQTYTVSGTFQAAVWASSDQQDLSSAAQVQCPSGYPISCSAISEPDYCCAANTYCAAATNGEVGCCPTGQTCSGSVGGSGGYKPTSEYVAPSPTTQYVGVAGGAATTVYQPTTEYQQATTEQYVNQGFCTTIIADGPNLPTTANANCGLALVVSDATREVAGWARAVAVLVGFQILGAMVLAWR